AAGRPLAKRDDVLTVLPGTLPPDVLAARLRTSDAAVILKLGRTFPGVVQAAEGAAVADRAVYVERASAPEQRIAPLREVGSDVPYMSLVLVPAGTAAARREWRAGAGERFGGVELRVVPGLSAMQAAAARVGAPLGHDFCVISLSDQRKPWAVIERRLEAAAGADLALALYNPASRSRREQLERAVG